MAISTSDIDNLPDYTDAQLLKLYRWAITNGAAGTTRSINNRSVSFPSLTEMMAAISWLEDRIAAADGNGGMNALVQFGEPS